MPITPQAPTLGLRRELMRVLPSRRSSRGTTLAIKAGRIQGKVVGSTSEFLGIPYAKPPIAELRFAPPQPAAAWSELRDASSFGPSCPQVPGGALDVGPRDEDCLSVNVYTPDRLADTTPWPVMVFVHGGGFNGGASRVIDPHSLSEAGPVVIVTFNYRVGALGFLAHPKLERLRAQLPPHSSRPQGESSKASKIEQLARRNRARSRYVCVCVASSLASCWWVASA